MSSTQLFAFNQDGNAYLAGFAPNSFRGAMQIWSTLESRHLPPYIPPFARSLRWFHPDISPEELKGNLGYLPTRLFPGLGSGKEQPVEEIWDLAVSPKLTTEERIVLLTTFDNYLVRAENFRKVIDAFRRFDGDTNLDIQASVLERFCYDPSIIAVGWNQTSVYVRDWANRGEKDEETGEYRPYNCLTGTEHFWLFDELKKFEEGIGNV